MPSQSRPLGALAAFAQKYALPLLTGIVLALCLLAKASADSSSYGSDVSAACAAAQDEYTTAQGDMTTSCLDADGAELEGDCDIFAGALPEDTATIVMANNCMSASIDLEQAMADGDDYEPTDRKSVV